MFSRTFLSSYILFSFPLLPLLANPFPILFSFSTVKHAPLAIYEPVSDDHSSITVRAYSFYLKFTNAIMNIIDVNSSQSYLGAYLFNLLLCSALFIPLSLSFFLSFFFLTVAFLRSILISGPSANESFKYQVKTSWAYTQNTLTSSVAVLLPGTLPLNLQFSILFFPLSLSLTRSLPPFFLLCSNV